MYVFIYTKTEFRVPMLPLRSQYTPSSNSFQLTPDRSPGLKASETLRSVHTQLPISAKHSKENRRPESYIDSFVRPDSTSRIAPKRFSMVVPEQTKAQEKTRLMPLQRRSDNQIMRTSHASDAVGRFERDFIEVDKIGAGEFGSVIKVQYKDDRQGSGNVFAVKKSKPFEGNRHRLVHVYFS